MRSANPSFRVRFTRGSFLLLSIIYVVCIVIQILIAGLATFVSPANWAYHEIFVHIFGLYLPLLMLIMAFIGRMPSFVRWLSAGLIVLLCPMYITANISAALFPWVAAAHPVIAMVLFWMSITVVLKSWKFMQSQ